MPFSLEPVSKEGCLTRVQATVRKVGNKINITQRLKAVVVFFIYVSKKQGNILSLSNF